MPVNLPSLTGKVPYEVERALRELAAAVDGLERRILAPDSSAGAIAALQREVGQINARLQVIVSQVAGATDDTTAADTLHFVKGIYTGRN